MKYLRLPLVLAIVFFAVGVALHAQETWTAPASPTTQNLWSISYGAGQFVAVGDGGTILTSVDSVVWTKRVSGTTQLLLGVGFGNGLFVAVGAQGTILTSPDGIVWTPRVSKTTAQLNGAVFGNGTWLVVAENDRVLSSPDAIAWTSGSLSARLRGVTFGLGSFVTTGGDGSLFTSVDAATFSSRPVPTSGFIESVTFGFHRFVAVGEGGLVLTSSDSVTWRTRAGGSGVSAYLRGVANFNNTFVAVGNGGAIFTSPDGETYTPRASGSAALLTAVAAGNGAVVAVGFGGTILRSLAANAPPAILTQPAAVTDLAGSNVAFTVAVSGSVPLTYQWLKDGKTLADATTDTLFLPGITSASTGAYSCVVSNAFGTVTSAGGPLNVVSGLVQRSLVDSTFAPSLVFGGPVTDAVEQSDGKVVIIGGPFYVAAGVPPAAIARLNIDGSLDTSFNLGSGPNGPVQHLAIQTDGRVLVAGSFTALNGVTRSNLARLNTDGSLDTSFSAPTILTTSPAQIATQSDGKILALLGNQIYRLNLDGGVDTTFTGPSNGVPVGSFAPLQNGAIITLNGSTAFVRLNADGSKDSTYAGGTINGKPSFSVLNEIAVMKPTLSGRAVFSYYYGKGSIAEGLLIGALNLDGTQAGNYGFNIGVNPQYDVYQVSADRLGKIIVYLRGHARLVFTTTRFLRITTDMTVDNTFNAGSGPDGDVSGIFSLRDGRTLISGNFTKFDGVSVPALARLVDTNAISQPPPAILSVTPASGTARIGEPLTLTVAATGSAPLSYQWSAPVVAGDQDKATAQVSTNTAGTYFATVTVTNPAGTTTSVPIRVVVAPSAPVITVQPLSAAAASGRSVSFTVNAVGSATFTYQWFRGATIVSTASTLTLDSVTATAAGDYTVVVTNSLGSTVSQKATLTVDSSARLVNISTRASVGTGDRVLIAGFVVGGSSAKTVLIRGIGPGLGQFGLLGLLPDPVITLFDSAGNAIAANDNWSSAATPTSLFNSVGAFPLSGGSADAVLQATLAPGKYSVQVADKTGQTGIGLVELYEADTNANRLINLSSRGFVGTGASIGIGGIAVRGETPKQFLIRGVGPALTPFGVSGALADPTITLTNNLGVAIATNDDWNANSNAADIPAAMTKAGAFPLPTGSKDAVLLVTLPPGNYSALLSGVNNTTGIALVEIYEVP